MTLSPTDIQSIKEALKPEFDKVRAEFSGEFVKVNSEFTKVHAEAKQNFTILSKKIESLKRSNRKEHNLIIKVFDERDIALKKRVKALEDKSLFPPFKNL